MSRERQRQVNRWPWVQEASAVREGSRVQGARELLGEMASPEGLWSFLSPFKEKK